jgi:hypothetical protein
MGSRPGINNGLTESADKRVLCAFFSQPCSPRTDIITPLPCMVTIPVPEMGLVVFNKKVRVINPNLSLIIEQCKILPILKQLHKNTSFGFD